MNCETCGLLKCDTAVGTILPQCMCRFQPYCPTGLGKKPVITHGVDLEIYKDISKKEIK